MGKSTYKLGTCKWCRTEGEVYRDNMLCDTCDSDTVYCSVCRSREHYESKCRHVFQSHGWGEWRGAGFDPIDAEMKAPFHRLLSAMGEEFAVDLKAAIRRGKFFTWMIAPMIGGGGMLELNGMPLREGRSMLFEWGDSLIKLGEGPQADKLHDGYCWLVSLYKSKTTKANRTTVAWIDEWLWPFTPRKAA